MGNTMEKESAEPERQRVVPKKSSSLSSSGRSRSIHEGLVRERDKKSELTEYYEIIDEIGQGGLCKVFKIRKKQEKIGGSSREENIRIPKRRFFGNIVPPSPVRRHSKRFSSGNIRLRAKSEDGSASAPSLTHLEEDFPTSVSYSSLRSISDMYFALKEINLAMVREDKIDQLRNEVEILKALDHKNIVKAYETFRDKRTKKLMIVMELCTGGDLVSIWRTPSERSGEFLDFPCRNYPSPIVINLIPILYFLLCSSALEITVHGTSSSSYHTTSP